MAGRGPAPKDSSTRVRRNKPPTAERVIEIRRQSQPSLVDLYGDLNPQTGQPWRSATFDLWTELATYPPAADWTRVQWHTMASATMLYDAFLSGETRLENAVRQWFAQFPIFPTDLLRHRITMVMAEEAEASAAKKQPAKKSAAKKKAEDPRNFLTVVS